MHLCGGELDFPFFFFFKTPLISLYTGISTIIVAPRTVLDIHILRQVRKHPGPFDTKHPILILVQLFDKV